MLLTRHVVAMYEYMVHTYMHALMNTDTNVYNWRPYQLAPLLQAVLYLGCPLDCQRKKCLQHAAEWLIKRVSECEAEFTFIQQAK